ncbi:hypothetical protein MTR67_018425 [Solanum verrucosum]|uniref:ubiquitinyl hydrolase 1 n=1 Tax=Solanum verrucosum TaxID=315347 RepID=A0AAF0QMB9_SOLVR|nr:hypothetical protein MTR67_018425 [Solanum verrucosum]
MVVVFVIFLSYHQTKKDIIDMQDQEGDVAEAVADTEKETLTSSETDDWKKYRDDDIMQQHSAIQAEQAVKVPFVGDKASLFYNQIGLIPAVFRPIGNGLVLFSLEPLSSLEAEYHLGNSIVLKKIKVLSEQYAAIRRTRGDGNCFFRSFMFGYLEHILESQDHNEVQHIKANIEECKKTLQSLGYAEFTFEDFFAVTCLSILLFAITFFHVW